jgi:hypothetical protein
MRIGVVIARNVRAERVRRGLRQGDLGAQLVPGWPIDRVSALETGRRVVQADDLPLLCRALDVSLVDLLAYAETPDLSALRIQRG